MPTLRLDEYGIGDVILVIILVISILAIIPVVRKEHEAYMRGEDDSPNKRRKR